MKEEWRWIPGWEGKYEVSNLGYVRSYAAGHKGFVIGRWRFKNGYLYVRLGNPPKAATVHSLVASAFLGPKPTGMQINHKDFDRTNPCVDNLEYVSPAENNRHATRAGVNRWGTIVKLDKDKVLAIRKSDLGAVELANLFGVCPEHIRRIKSGKSWAWVS